MLSRSLTRLQPTRMAAPSRLAALSAHFSSSAAPAAAAPAPAAASSAAAAPGAPKAKTQAPEPPVLFEAVHSLRKVTLNRPAKLNTLNAEIVGAMKAQMEVGLERRTEAGGGLPKLSGRGGQAPGQKEKVGSRMLWLTSVCV